jgi:calcium/calmodulin-dependent protein kinase I
MAKARLRRGIERVKLANRIAALRMQVDDGQDVPDESDIPASSVDAVDQSSNVGGLQAQEPSSTSADGGKKKLSKVARSAIFREVVLAKVREMKEQEERAKLEKTVTEMAKKGGS